MRVAALAACLIGIAACHDDPYGAMIEASGDIEFDHVEVFFGHEVGFETPLTPNRLQRTFLQPQETQLLTTRLREPDDELRATDDPRETRWSYLVPYNEENKQLGRYALVVVSKDGQDVGAAEVFDFEVPSDALYRYLVPIVPLENEDFERWGDGQGCVRWTRPREGDAPDTVAVVDDAANPDCDVFLAEDCDELRHCDPSNSDPETSGCLGPDACLIPIAEGCAAGDCVNKIAGEQPPCEIATCIDGRLCNACDSQDPQVIVECAATANVGGNTHPDLNMPLLNRTLCTKPSYDFILSVPFPCLEPRIEAVENYYMTPGTTGPEFLLEAFQGSSTNTCKIRVTEPFPGAEWIGTPHIVMSVSNTTNGFRRMRFAFGLYDNNTSCTAATGDIYRDEITGCSY